MLLSGTSFRISPNHTLLCGGTCHSQRRNAAISLTFKLLGRGGLTTFANVNALKFFARHGIINWNVFAFKYSILVFSLVSHSVRVPKFDFFVYLRILGLFVDCHLMFFLNQNKIDYGTIS